MRQLSRRLLGIVVLSISSGLVVYSQSPAPVRQNRGPLVEEFSFLIKDFKTHHQTENHNLNISISFRYVSNITKSEYPDFRWLAKDVETLLTNYPNEDDYWEIVNKQITLLLLTKYRSLATITCELKVDPSPLVPYTRSSRVTRARPASIRKR